MKAMITAAVMILIGAACTAAERAVPVPAPVFDSPKSAGPLQSAVLAGGCFWGVEGVFEHLTGVTEVVSGYAGGPAAAAPTLSESLEV